MGGAKPTSCASFVSRELSATRQAVVLAGHRQPVDIFCGVSTQTLLDGHHGGVVDGLHDGSQAAAQVVGLADVHLRGVFEDHCVR